MGTYGVFLPLKRARGVFALKRAVYHVLTCQGCSLVCFANQQGTLARVFQQLGQEGGDSPHPCTPLVKTAKEMPKDMCLLEPKNLSLYKTTLSYFLRTTVACSLSL